MNSTFSNITVTARGAAGLIAIAASMMWMADPVSAQDDHTASRIIEELNSDQVDVDRLAAILQGQPNGGEIGVDAFRPDQPAPMVRVGPRPRTLDHPAALAAAAVDLPALEPGEAVDATFDAMRVGRVAALNLTSQAVGSWIVLPDGGRLWSGKFQSPNAAGLRLRIEPFDPPPGAELVIYNAGDPTESYGPKTASRARAGLPYWTPRVFGNAARLEYYLPPDVKGEHQLNITGALLLFPSDNGEGGIAGWDSCQVDATCESGWDFDALSVAHIQFVSGGSGFICSGAMINRLPDFDGTPYFLTASHCISTEAEANSIEVYWLFQSSVCNGSVPSLNSVPRTDGSTVLANASDPDHTLLGLTMDDIPGGLVWAGWGTGSPGDPQAGTEIHHPLGAPKSISHGNFEGNDNGCGSPINTTFRFDISSGGQAGGSSGAPVFTDSDHRIRAVVSCSETDACSPSENAWEGRFSTAYPTFSPFLDTAIDVWVNGAWGGAEQGTLAFPWDEVIEGHFGVRGGGTLHIQAGTYQQYTFNGGKPFTVRAQGGSVVFQ